MSQHSHQRHGDGALPDHLAMLALESHFKYGGRADWRPYTADVAEQWPGEHPRQS